MKKLLLIVLLIVGCIESDTTAPEPEDCAGVAGGDAIEDCADVCGGGNICGCTDATAANFNSLATYDDGSCAHSPDITLTQQQVISSNNSFGIKLFKELNQTDPISSVFVSPLSISMALGMTLNGADNETYEAMIEVLEKADLSEVEINEAYQSLIALLTQLDEDVILNIANSIWYKDTFTVEQTFLDVNQTYFDAVVEALDFTNVSLVVNTINGWVNENTNELIPTIIKENYVTPETIMFLVNAIYYKGTWTTEFDPELTEDKPFYNYDNTTSTVPLMHMESTLSVSVTETFVAVDLPYGDELFSMTVILPNVGVDINEFAAELNNENWDQWMSGFNMVEDVQLYLPRFTLEWKNSLTDILSTMGMGIAFSDQADFSRINSGVSLKITDVIHKTFVEVNEEGTEAAAVTVIGITTTSIEPPPPVIRVDRPFIFAIREKSSGTILFIGKVLNL